MNNPAQAVTRLLLCVALLSGCASFPPNPRLSQFDPAAGYRFDQLNAVQPATAPTDQGDAPAAKDPRNRLFVVLAFSGGGTRAAALSHGVLKALRDTTIEWQGQQISLLDEVDVISSISGGSFPAAYYGLYRERIFAEFPDKFLYRPIQSDLIKQVFHPDNLLKLAGPSYGRSDLAADFYNREVFDGGTYGDLIQQERRPFVILNATDMTTGTQFPFIQDQFDLLCSDLAGVPLARAAAASSAFPGGLTALTFQNYAGECGYREPPWVKLAIDDQRSRVNPQRTAYAETRRSYSTGGEQRRNFIHLTDGGVADNIGLRGPLASLTSVDHPWSLLRLINLEEIDKLVVIVVNAATDPKNPRDSTPNVPGLVDTLTTAATVPLDNYTFDTLQLLKSTVYEYNASAQMIRGCKKLAARKGKECELEIPGPYEVELYPVQVAFDFINDATERDWFKNLPTTLELPPATVNRLCEIGRRLLSEDPKFNELIKQLKGRMPSEDKSCRSDN